MDRPKLEKYIVHLDSQHNLSVNTIGGKALHLMELIQNGYCVASGFIITVDAYKDFMNAHHLDSVVNNELGKKFSSRCAGRKCGMLFVTYQI